MTDEWWIWKLSLVDSYKIYNIPIKRQERDTLSNHIGRAQVDSSFYARQFLYSLSQRIIYAYKTVSEQREMNALYESNFAFDWLTKSRLTDWGLLPLIKYI